MNTQKFLVSGIVGGIVSFFAGYLIYGLLLADFFAKNSTPGVMKQMSEIVWWALIAGNLCWGLAYSYIFGRAGINSLASGAGTGFVFGLLSTAAMDLIMYGTANISTMNGTLADIVCGAIIGMLVGAGVGAANGMGNKKAAA